MESALDQHFNLLMSDIGNANNSNTINENNNLTGDDIPDNLSVFNTRKNKSSISFKNIVYWICIVLLVIIVCVIVYYILCKLFLIVPKEEKETKKKKEEEEEEVDKTKKKKKSQKKAKAKKKIKVNLKKIKSLVSDDDKSDLLSDLESEISLATTSDSDDSVSNEKSTKSKIDLYLKQIAQTHANTHAQYENNKSIPSNKIEEMNDCSTIAEGEVINTNKELMMELYKENKNNTEKDKDRESVQTKLNESKKRRGRPRKHANE